MSPSLAQRAAWSAQLAWRAPLEGRFPFRRPQAIERAQRRRVEQIVAHAYEHVPYYRETMRGLGLGPGDLRTAADLAKLPLIDREQLQRDPEYFLSRAHPGDAQLKLRSGGSTGEPVSVFWDRRALMEVGGRRERLRSVLLGLTGRRWRYREARIVLPHDSSLAAIRAFSATSLIPRSLRVDCENLSMLDGPEANVRRINELRPDVISAYGSYIEALFGHVIATGAELHRPKAVIYGGDPLSERMRELIGEMGIEVLSAYGSIETFNIAFECERHTGLHVDADFVPVRVLDSEGREAPPGETGEIVVSNLFNRATVLLNYRLGDLAARLPEPCPCGRTLPLLSFLEARTDDWLEKAGGGRLHPQWFRAALSREPAVWRYQAVQHAPGRVRVDVVPAPGAASDELRARLVRELEDRLGDGAEVEVAYVDSLPRSARGKVRPVMSLEARRRLEREAAR